MASVRLAVEQIDRLRESDNAAAVIRHALRRWQRGDFVIAKRPKRQKRQNSLQVYPLWQKPDGVADWQLREILDAHFRTPDAELRNKCDAEIARLDREIKGFLKCLPTVCVEG